MIMEKKSRKELLSTIDELASNLQKYKSKLHDVVKSYKHLVTEKEALEISIKSLTAVNDNTSEPKHESNERTGADKSNDDYLQNLKSSLGALTAEKSRVENELRTDRKKLLFQIEELERKNNEIENQWFLDREKYGNQILDLKKKITHQQKEREKEQQDHALMLKELQNVLATERTAKEKLEQQISELNLKCSAKLPEKKMLDYEKCIDDLQNKLKIAQQKTLAAENSSKNCVIVLDKLQKEMEDLKIQYQNKIEEEMKRSDAAEEKLKLLTLVKEKRIASLESRISELSEIVGNYDKMKQQDQTEIQKLKEKIAQLHCDNSTFGKINSEDKLWEYGTSNTEDLLNSIAFQENAHSHCQAEIMQLRVELEHVKSKAEIALKEKYNKMPNTLADIKSTKEIKELKSRVTQLQDQLQSAKSQLKLNEEYHNKITNNLEKLVEELKAMHKQEIVQSKMNSQAQIMELENQIQKQRERTLALLEEKDKEIGMLKSTFLSSVIKEETSTDLNHAAEPNNDSSVVLLSNSLFSSPKDSHMLHYIHEIARKDVEIANLRKSHIQTESALRKLQQISAVKEEKYMNETESLKQKIRFLETSNDKNGTNVEYLKNVVLRFLKCNDPNSRRHMVNAIATVLHFTSSEVHEVKSYLKPPG